MKETASMARDLLSLADLSASEILDVLKRACDLKRGATSNALAGKSVALLFEKPSLRTRVGFDLAIHQLGGHPVYLGRDEVSLDQREPVSDVARVLARYVDAIVVRVFSHGTLVEMAQHSGVPVINALSDVEHPCQALADLQTVYEKRGTLQGVRIAYIGDGNNVAASLALACASVGADFSIASPAGYQLPDTIQAAAARLARGSGARVSLVSDPAQAVNGADVVYTDVWTSMGQEEEAGQRRQAFEGFQVNSTLLEQARPGALFMHPLPAHYGEEVEAGLQLHPQSVVFEQAENRLHTQKAALELLLA